MAFSRFSFELRCTALKLTFAESGIRWFLFSKHTFWCAQPPAVGESFSLFCQLPLISLFRVRQYPYGTICGTRSPHGQAGSACPRRFTDLDRMAITRPSICESCRERPILSFDKGFDLVTIAREEQSSRNRSIGNVTSA